jgi:hypothetical protein
MSDKEARAVGAASSLEVDGKRYVMSPIGFRQLQEIQREAVRYWKRQYMLTFADNVDLLANGDGQELIRQKMEECAKWGIDKLPVKIAYSAAHIKITDKLRKRLRSCRLTYEDLPESDRAVRALLTTALDNEEIHPDIVEKLTNTRPRQGRVAYDTWWITAVYEGMVAFVWASLSQKHPELTREEISEWPLDRIIEIAREVEHITAPELGNT